VPSVRGDSDAKDAVSWHIHRRFIWGWEVPGSNFV